MNDLILKVIPLPTLQHTLQGLLATYQSEKAESQADNDTRFTEYWESACQTIYDVAAELKVPLEEQQSKRRLHKPDSMTPLRSVDVQLTEGV